MDWLNDIELIPISYEEWKIDNGQYVDDSTKAADYSYLI